MKKMIFMAAIAVGVMTSCTNSEMVDISEGRAISFQNSAMTRGDHGVTGQFNVIAYKGTTVAPTDYPISGNTRFFTDVYTLAPTNKYGASADKMYYYDGVTKHFFYCYAGTNARDGAKGATGIGTISASDLKDGTELYSDLSTFITVGTGNTVPDITYISDTHGSIDLVTASKDVAADEQTGSQALHFYHALARVRFTAKTDTYSDVSPIKITKIQYTVNEKEGTISRANFGAALMVAEGSKPGITYTLQNTFQPKLLSTLEQVNTDKQVLYVIPQNLGTSGTLGKLRVEYTVNGLGIDGAAATTPFFKVFDIDTDLVKGKSYNYQITINLNAITFSAVLEDWATEEVEEHITPEIP